MPFSVLSIFVTLFFIAFAVLFVCILVKNITEWINNNNSPVLEREAVVADLYKRDDTSMMPTGPDGAMMMSSDTLYYVKFEIADGSVMEFKINRSLWNSLRTGMRGTLISQGTRFKDFTPF